MACVDGTCLEQIRRKRIPVMTSKTGKLMHHKFIVVDAGQENEVTATGSFNWTREALCSNNENLLITNDPTAVRKLKQEFERIWATGPFSDFK